MSLVFLKRRVMAGVQYKPGDEFPAVSPIPLTLIEHMKLTKELVSKEEYEGLIRSGKTHDPKKVEDKAPEPKEEVSEVVEEVQEDEPSEPETKYTKEYLESLGMKELRKIGNEFGEKDNKASDLIEKILAHVE